LAFCARALRPVRQSGESGDWHGPRPLSQGQWQRMGRGRQLLGQCGMGSNVECATPTCIIGTEGIADIAAGGLYHLVGMHTKQQITVTPQRRPDEHPASYDHTSQHPRRTKRRSEAVPPECVERCRRLPRRAEAAETPASPRTGKVYGRRCEGMAGGAALTL